MKRILIVTDAWHPQVNGVVTTLDNLVKVARQKNDYVEIAHPEIFPLRFPMPGYREIKLALPMPWQVKNKLTSQRWDHIHIATLEGPIGQSFSRQCRKLNIKFTTSYHTKFPDFINARYPFIKAELGWRFMRHIYKNSKSILATTDSMRRELVEHGFTQKIKPWDRGINRSLYKPNVRKIKKTKTLLSVSRVSKEKNLDAFCQLQIPQTKKVLVGDGPYLDSLKKRYNDVIFVGKKTGDELAQYYQQADVLVFTSHTDTFGIVNIEAIACGTPVASLPVTGPIDIIQNGVNGFIDKDLVQAIHKCIKLDRAIVAASSAKWSWENCYQQFWQILEEHDG